MSFVRNLWEYDAIQFPRLIAEVSAMEPTLNDFQIQKIVEATRMLPSEIAKTVRKAERIYEDIIRRSSGLEKKRWVPPETIKEDARFAKLLYGIYQAGLSPDQWYFLRESMDLDQDHLKELFLRAAEAYMRELET